MALGRRGVLPHEGDLQLMLYESPNLIPMRGGEEAPC
jgi:hypothetical protein